METSLFEVPANAGVVMLDFPELGSKPETAVPAFEFQEEERVLEQAMVRQAAEERAWQQRLADAREEAAAEAREHAEERFHQALDVERTAITMACTSFSKARERYFGNIEAEVVRLSLAVAARILQREASMDPLLLMGAVRVALARVAAPEGAVLRTSVEEVDLWARAMKSSGMAVEADPALPRGELQLHTTAGVAELGVQAQLVEIERGFFDLLARRPA